LEKGIATLRHPLKREFCFHKNVQTTVFDNESLHSWREIIPPFQRRELVDHQELSRCGNSAYAGRIEGLN